MYKIILLILTVIMFHSCCPEATKELTDNNTNGKHPPIKKETQVQINQSIVELQVEEIFKGTGNDFVVKAKVLSVEENPSYASIAVKGNSYHLLPQFRLDENGKVKNNEENEKLASLTKLQSGDKFKAVITFELNSGWYIIDIL